MRTTLILLLFLVFLAGCQNKGAPGEGVALEAKEKVSDFEENIARNAVVLDVTSSKTEVNLINNSFEFNLEFSKNTGVENCTPTVKVKVAGDLYTALYTGGSETKIHTYSLTLPGNLMDLDGVEVTNPIIAEEGCVYDFETESKNPAILQFESKKLENIFVDQISPRLVNFSVSPTSSVTQGDAITIKANFSEIVNLTAASSSLNFTLNGFQRTATYHSGKDSKQLTYKYTTTSSDRNLAGLGISSLPSNLVDEFNNQAIGPQNNLTLNYTIISLDSPPVSSPISGLTVNEDTTLIVNLTYTDAEGDLATSCATSALSNAVVTQPCTCSAGVCQVGVSGSLHYFGPASLKYTVSTGGKTSQASNINFTVNPVDDAPLVSNFSVSNLQEDVSTLITLNYNDPESHEASACTITNPVNISLSQPCTCSAGVCRVGIMGLANYNGPASFNYSVSANSLTSNIALASISINSVDDAPVANNINPPSFNEDITSTIELNYTDVDGQLASSCTISNLQNITTTGACTCSLGTCSVPVRGLLNYFGSASFNYSVTVGGVQSNLASANFTINPINDPPVVSNISPGAFNEDTTQIINFNYTDVESDQAASCQLTSLNNITVSSPCTCSAGACSAGVRGILNYHGPGSFQYSITAGGQTSNSATATLSVTSVDDAPVVTPLNGLTVVENTPLTINIPYTDVENDLALTCNISNLQNASTISPCLCVAGICSLTIQGNLNFVGVASFDFQVTTGLLLSNTESASINVIDFNYPPVADNINGSTFNEDQVAIITLPYNDQDGDEASSCTISNLSNITVTTPCSCTSGTCQVGVRGLNHYFGPASFRFSVTANGLTSNQANANLTINSVDDAPVANSLNPPAFNEDTISTITLSYNDVESHQATTCSTSALNSVTVTTPCSCTAGVCSVSVRGINNHFGPASFNYTITANGLTSAPSPVNLTINGVDDAPVANNITPPAFNEDTISTITLNYSDTESHQGTTCSTSSLNSITVTTPCSCSAGVCTVSVRGSNNYQGPASFNYTITANGLVSNSATATLSIASVDDAPVASNITPPAFNEDTNSTITLSYTDVESHQGSSCNISNLSNITISTPCSCSAGVCTVGVIGNAHFNGGASFNYTITANGLVSNMASATLSITSVDDAPVANPSVSPLSLAEDTTTVVTLNYSDVENHLATSCTVTAVNNLQPNPSCACNGSGVCGATLRGLNNYAGAASFTYTVTANGLTSNSVTSNLTITATDDPPVAGPPITPVTFNEDTLTEITVGYSDPENDTATACSVTSVTNLQSSPSCTCTAGVCKTSVIGILNYNGSASFSYTVTANGATSAPFATNLTINPVDDAPVASTLISPNSINEDTSTEITLAYNDVEGQLATACNILGGMNLQGGMTCSCVSGVCKTTVIGQPNYNGPANLNYTVTAGGLLSAPVIANLTINSVDDAPVANSSVSPLSFAEDTTTVVTLNYSDPENHLATSCTVTAVNNLQPNPSCACNGSGVCGATLRGLNNYAGAASFTYTVTANGLTSNSVTSNLTITTTDDPPVAGPPITPVTFNEDTLTEITVGYSDPENDTATACSVTSVTNLQSSPSCTCTAGVCKTSVIGVLNYNGSASFQYTVTANGVTSAPFGTNLTIHPVDDAPVASSVTPPSFNENTQSLITLSYNDVESHLATSCSLSSLSNVTITQACACDGAGVCRVGVTGALNYNGPATFNYTVTANTLTSNAAPANLTISPIVRNPDAANSTITGSGPVAANGSATSNITITIKDQYNDAVVGIAPTFSATNTNSTNVYGACSSTNASGVSTCTLRSTTAELKTLSITSPVTKSGGTVQFTAGAAVAANSTITGSGPVQANGSATSTVTITLKDNYNNLVSGVTPNFNATNSGTKNTYGACSVSNASGVSTCTLASTKAEVKTLNITSPFAKSGGTVTFTPGAASAAHSSISGTTPVASDGISVSMISINLNDAFGNPISGVIPIFNATNTGNNNVYGACISSDSTGLSTCTLSSTTAENKVLQMTSPTAVTGSTIQFTASAPSAINSTIAGTTNILADGTATSTVTITIRDAANNPIANGYVPSFEATDTDGMNAYDECTPTTSGVSTCTFSSTKAEVKTLKILDPVVKSGGTVTFVAGAAASLYSTITGTGPVVADNVQTSTITITLRDINNNPVSGGSAPTFTVTGSVNNMSACSVPNASGVSTCTVRSTQAELKTLNIATPFFKTGGTVQFIAGTPTVANSTITGNGPVPPDGVSTSTVSITLRDQYSNNVSGVSPTFTATGTNNIYGTCTPSNSSGVSTCTFASTSAGTKTLSITSPVSKTGGNVIFAVGAAFAANCSISGTGPVTANNSSTSTITITLRDSNNTPIQSVTPTFTASGTGNTQGTCSLTNASGISTCTLRSSKAEIKTLELTAPTTKTGGTVTFVPGAPSATTSTISASGPVISNGTDQTTVTINIKDALGNGVPNQTPTYSMTGTYNTLGACSPTDADGVSTCLASSVMPQYKTFALTAPVAVAGNTVRFNPIGFDFMVPIEMLGVGISSTTAVRTYTLTQTRLNTDDYVSELNTYFFEIVALNTSTTVDYTVSLLNASSAVVSTLTIPKNTTTPKRFRTEWTPTTGANTYRIRLPATTFSNEIVISSARMIVQQHKGIATNIYIPLLGAPGSTFSNSTTAYVAQITNTAYSNFPVGYFNNWKRDDNKYNYIDNTTNPWMLEVVMRNSGSGTAYAALYNHLGSVISDSQITASSTTLRYLTKSFSSTAANFQDGDILNLRARSGTSTQSARLSKAGLWLKLDFLKNLEIYNKISFANLPSGISTTFLPQARYLWEESHWSHPFVFFESFGIIDTSSASLVNVGATDTGTSGVDVATAQANSAYGPSRVGPIALNDGDSYIVKHNASGSTSLHGAGFLIVRASETVPLQLALDTGFDLSGTVEIGQTGVIRVENSSGTPPYFFTLNGPGSIVSNGGSVNYTPPASGFGTSSVSVTDSSLPPQSTSITFSYRDSSLNTFASCKQAYNAGLSTGMVNLDFDGVGPRPARDFYCDMTDPNNIKLYLKQQTETLDNLRAVAASEPGNTGIIWTDRNPANAIKEINMYPNPTSGSGWDIRNISLAGLPAFKNVQIGVTSNTVSAGMGAFQLAKDGVACFYIADAWTGSRNMQTIVDGVTISTNTTQQNGTLRTALNCNGTSLDIGFGRNVTYPTMSWFYIRELIITEQ